MGFFEGYRYFAGLLYPAWPVAKKLLKLPFARAD